MYNETYVKNTKRRGTMLDISYYEKTDEIIAQYTCEEKSLIPIIQGIQEEYRYPVSYTHLTLPTNSRV